MPQEIKIKAGNVEVEATLNDSTTAKMIIEKLPIESTGNRWGDEIYFSIPVNIELEEDSRDILEAGELGYWPTGSAFCIFWGPTPASRSDEIRAASNVNIIGKIKGDCSILNDVPDGEQITIEPAI
ncbi:MAG: cyclophilin-like fold protein [Planctomycetota bacterium]